MKRNGLLVVLHSFLTAGLLAVVIVCAVTGDGWRVFFGIVALACLLAVRDDLTRNQP